MVGCKNKPHILLIMSDECAAWACGAYGHPFIRTPNLDRLAQRGMTFDAAYCNSPLCGPSRASFLTGLLPHKIDAWDNGKPLRSDAPTWAHYLALAGYQTVLVGKQHFVGPDQTHGFERRLGEEIHTTRIRPLNLDPFNGPFDYTRWLRVGVGRSRFLDYDDAVAAQAAAFLLGEGRDRSRPFALCASFITPHYPLTVEERHLNMYWPQHADLPPVPEGYVERMHPVWRHHRQFYGVDAVDEERLRRARAAYCALCTYMDEKVGEVLDALDRSGLADDTLLIYTSDHGELAGHHRMWWKCSFFEQSVRVPMIVSWPGHIRAQTRSSRVVSLVDLCATMLDAAGAVETAGLDGRSFVPLLRGEDQPWDDVALSELYVMPAPAPQRMIRQGRFKLNFFADHPPELYDLESDPDEWHDLAGDPRYADVVGELIARVTDGWDLGEIRRRIDHSRRERTLILRAERTYLGPTPHPGT